MSLFDTHKPVTGGSNDFPDAEQLKFERPGDTVEGTILDVSDDIDGQFGTFRIVVLEDEKGQQWKILAGSVLLDKVKKANASAGGRIGIRFEGLVENKRKTAKYKDWTVVYAAPEGKLESGGVTSSRPSTQAPF